MPEQNKPLISIKKTLIRYGLVFLLLLCAVLFNKDLFRQILLEIPEIPVSILLWCCLLAVLYRILDGVCIYFAGRRHPAHLTVRNGISTAFSGSFFRVATAGAGMMAAKVVSLNKSGLSYGQGTGLCLFQYILYKAVILFMGILALLFYPDFLTALPVSEELIFAGFLLCILIILFLLMMTFSQNFSDFLFSCAFYFCRKKEKAIPILSQLQEEVSLLQEEARNILHDKKLFSVLLFLSVLMQCLFNLIPCMFADSLSLSVPLIFAAMSATFLLACAIPLPSGFGSMELLFTLFLAPLCSASSAATAILVFRFSSTIIPFILGLPSGIHLISLCQNGKMREKKLSKE